MSAPPPASRPQPASARRLAAAAAALSLGAAACTSSAASPPKAALAPQTRPTSVVPLSLPADRPAAALAPAPVASAAPTPVGTGAHAVVAALPALDRRLRPDVLVTGPHGLPPALVAAIAHLTTGAVAYASGTVHLGGKPVHVVSVDPASFRRFAAQGTAESTPVWQAVARGDALASHALAKALKLPLGGTLSVVGKQTDALRLGALATTGIPGADLVVGVEAGRRLGLTTPTSVLLSAGAGDPTALAATVRRVAGSAVVDLLSQPAADPVAFLSGSKAAKAFGAFSYRYFADGTIQPDSRWVATNIESATVPILGSVTCHRLMLTQLRGALTEVAAAGLSSSLHTYDGCYVPRFIERDPHHPISLHTWGIAIDMDAATNYRGIRGTMDPRVVAIFKRWGFRWGGDWTYTDPMHFELGALLTTPTG